MGDQCNIATDNHGAEMCTRPGCRVNLPDGSVVCKKCVTCASPGCEERTDPLKKLCPGCLAKSKCSRCTAQKSQGPYGIGIRTPAVWKARDPTIEFYTDVDQSAT